jgi:hypothetical protein
LIPSTSKKKKKTFKKQNIFHVKKFTMQKKAHGYTCWLRPVIPAPGRQRQKDQDLETNSGYIAECLKNKN